MRDLTEVILSIEELEAIRLKDLLGLEQEACAEKMGVSRPTYHRILSSARAKVADALVNGKAIRVEGGNYQVSTRRFRCGNCNAVWESPCAQGPKFTEMTCPECKGADVFRINNDGSLFNCSRWRDGKEIM